MNKLKCSGDHTNETSPETAVTYIDDKGFVYCTGHGLVRQRYYRCRKLRPHELKKLIAGNPLEKY